MRTNDNCASSTVIQPKLNYSITVQQWFFQLQPQLIQFTTNTAHFNISSLYIVSLNNTNVENYWLLSTNESSPFLSNIVSLAALRPKRPISDLIQ